MLMYHRPKFELWRQTLSKLHSALSNVRMQQETLDELLSYLWLQNFAPVVAS